MTVTLQGVDATREGVTEADGGFRFLDLARGPYKLTAALPGFSTIALAALRVAAPSSDCDAVSPPALNWHHGFRSHRKVYRSSAARVSSLWLSARSRFRRTLGSGRRLGLIQFSGRVATAVSLRNNRHAIAVSISDVLDSGC